MAAGSQRMGFIIAADPCSLGKAEALFSGNAAHTNLVGMILNAATSGGSCTQAVAFATYLNWDFGILSMKVNRGMLGRFGLARCSPYF